MKPIAGSVSVAGALPGLQNRGDDSVSPKPAKTLRKLPPSLAAQGKRAARNQPRLDAPKTPTLPPWSKHGPSCPRLSKLASWRW